MRTIPQLFETSVSRFGNNALIIEKKEGTYRPVSYREIAASVYSLAAGLIGLGLRRGDRVALVAEGRSEWLVSELAVLYLGAVSVPLSVKINEPEELYFRLEHSGSRMVIVSAQQLEKVRAVFNRCREMEKIILMDEVPGRSNHELLLSEIIEGGSNKLAGIRDILDQRWKSVREDDLANISYTSGTTADPKGIMLTHRNYTANLEQANSLIKVPEWYTTLLILSWDHSFAHTTGLYVMIRNGAAIGVVEAGKTPIESLRNIPQNIREIRPVFLLSVPALARSFKKSIETAIRAKGKSTARLFDYALDISYRYKGDGWSKRSTGQLILRPLHKLFDRILYSRIRENFGGRLKFFIGGGALLDIELQKFFYAIGMPMYQGYGLSEASPVISSNTPDVHKLGTSGKLVRDLQIKILDDDGNPCVAGVKGEIVVRGENVMKGYWNNERATAESLKEGWLHTGDLGFLDEDGFLHVLGRFKSLLIGNDGEKYSPEGIEETLIDNSVLIDQCMLYNNQNPYTVGLFVINGKSLRENLNLEGISPDREDALRRAATLIEEEFLKYRAGGEFENMFPQRWLPSAIAILAEPFTEENGMINSTLKMVRSRVAEHHRELIDYLYTAEGKQTTSNRNLETLGVLLNQ